MTTDACHQLRRSLLDLHTPLPVAQRLRGLLSLDRDSTEPFMRRYAERFDQSPALVHAHAGAIAALKAIGTVSSSPGA